MLLMEAFELCSDDAIVGLLSELHPDTDIPSYMGALADVRATVPGDPEGWAVGVALIARRGRDSLMTDVSGYPPGSDEAHAIEFCPWEEWLAMEILPGTLDDFGTLGTVARCLYEMTLVGYSRDEVSEERQMVSSRLDEASGMAGRGTQQDASG